MMNLRDSPTLVIVPGAVFRKKCGNKRGTLLVQEPGSLYSNSIFFSFFVLFSWGKMQELTQSLNQDKNWYERGLLGILTYLPHTWSLHCWATQLKCVEFKLPVILIPSTRITMVL
jgi:hypothetical protein